MISNNWQIHSSPFFSKAHCPKHRNPMVELQNGFIGAPVFWCSECKYPYQLEFVKMRKWDQEAVDIQLEAKKKKKAI